VANGPNIFQMLLVFIIIAYTLSSSQCSTAVLRPNYNVTRSTSQSYGDSKILGEQNYKIYSPSGNFDERAKKHLN